MAIKRNSYSEQFRDLKTRNRVVATTIYPDVEKTDTDIYIMSTSTDRLDLLANKYYGTPRLWWVIAQANEIGNGNMLIEPGTKLRIPQDINGILNKLERINKQR